MSWSFAGMDRAGTWKSSLPRRGIVRGRLRVGLAAGCRPLVALGGLRGLPGLPGPVAVAAEPASPEGAVELGRGEAGVGVVRGHGHHEGVHLAAVRVVVLALDRQVPAVA